MLCCCGGCLDNTSTGAEPEAVGGPSVAIDAAAEGYGLMMSSTVGILLQPVPGGAIAENDSYVWQCSGGQFLTWSAPDYTVRDHGTLFLRTQPTPVYWSPLVPIEGGTEVDGSSPVVVTLQVIDTDGALVAEAAPVTIERKDDGFWYAG